MEAHCAGYVLELMGTFRLTLPPFHCNIVTAQYITNTTDVLVPTIPS
jgi:hypothetical protein